MTWLPPIELHLDNWPAALLAFAPMLLNMGIFIYGYRKLTMDAQNVLYLLFVAGVVCWQAFDVGVRMSATPETASLFRAYLRPGQLLAINFGLHFVLFYVGLDRIARSGWMWFLLYVPPVLELGSFMSKQQMEVLVYRPGWGWLADAAQMHPFYKAYLAYGSVLSLVCLALLAAHSYRVRHDPGRREAAAMLAISFTIVVLVGISFETILPIFSLRQWPITSSACVIFSIAVLVGQRRYQLFDVSTPAVARAVVESVPDELLIVTADGHLLFANDEAAQRLGLDLDRIGTYELYAVVRDEGELRGAIDTLLSGGRPGAIETRLRLSDGRTAPYLVSLADIALNRAGDVGVALVAHHIGPLKETEQALELARDEAQSANRSKSEFLASMSHELRTPLNGIIGYSEMLQDEVDDPDMREDLGRIRTQGRYLLDLINDILDLSKVESGRLEVLPQSVELSHLLQDLDSQLQQLADKNRNQLRIDVPDGLPRVHADPMRVRQVVLNLVSNGAKFCEDGKLAVVARAEEDMVSVDVIDTGIGMDEAQSARLFQRFSQVHDKDHERYGGTGLGLALSQSLCQLMGGDLVLHRSAPGEGSTFRMTLPITTTSLPVRPGSTTTSS